MFPQRKSSWRAFHLAIAFLLFQRNAPPGKRNEQTEDLADEITDFSRIRCPLCRWQPNASSLWYCADAGYPHNFNGCGTAWNTFDTRGRCPGCNHQWVWTDCHRCYGCSPHEEWYAEEFSQM